MALITVSGEPGCRLEEVARIAAQRLQFELITEPVLAKMIVEEFGSGTRIPDRAYRHVTASTIARLGLQHHLVVAIIGSETLFNSFPGRLRVRVEAPEIWRIGTVIVERRVDRQSAKELLHEMDLATRAERKRRVRRGLPRSGDFDLTFNAESFDSGQIADIIASTAEGLGFTRLELLSPAVEAQMQFEFRMELSRFGIAPPGVIRMQRGKFGHPSEQIFGNLLDFYRIPWEYEPRSFPIRWDDKGKVVEAFTPDFYLPETDLYVELTTAKQAHVTRKNRKVKLLKTIYPDINIQVFYQKDFQNLIFKYGLAERILKA